MKGNTNLRGVECVFLEFWGGGQCHDFCQHVLMPLHLHTNLCTDDQSLAQWQRSCAKDAHLQSVTA